MTREVERLTHEAMMLAFDAQERLSYSRTPIPPCDVCAELGATCKDHEEVTRLAKDESDRLDTAFRRLWARIGETLALPGCVPSAKQDA
jgi:hypothetical protein